METLVSIIVPAYKVTAYIAETLDSIFAQTFTGYEVIVVNDGCPDTVALEKVLEPYQSRIRYIRQENKGLPGARNTAIRASRAPYLALLDSDDKWFPHYLETQLRVARENPDADVIYGDALLFGDGEFSGKRFMEICPSVGPVTLESVASQQCNVMVSVLAKRETVERVGLFDETFRGSEDYELWGRLLLAGGRIIYHNEVIVYYRRRADSMTASRIGMMQTHLQALRKFLTLPGLTEAERGAVNSKIAEVEARRQYYTGLGAIRDGAPAGQAIEHLRESNQYLKSRKVSLMMMGLHLSPPLMRYLIRAREA